MSQAEPQGIDDAPRSFGAFLLGTHPGARDPSSPAAIIRFSAIAVVVYTILIIFQPTLHRAYGYWFRGLGDIAFKRVSGVGSVSFIDLNSDRVFEQLQAVTPVTVPDTITLPKLEGEKDTLLVLQHRERPGKIGLFRSGSRLMAFIPSALFLALLVATPLPWLRRLAVFGIGFVLLHMFILFRMWLYVAKVGFADTSKQYHIYEFGDFRMDVLRRTSNVLVDDPTFNYIVPVVIWLITVLAISIWKRRQERVAESTVNFSKRRRRN